MANFFIGGAPRSGGTLLMSILCADETTNPALRETHYLRGMILAYMQGRQTFDSLEGGHFFTDRNELDQFSSSWINAFLEKIEKRYSPASNLVLKSFLMSVMFPTVSELLPDARFIISVRDPRDIACSQIEVGEKQKSQGKNVRFPRQVGNLSRENVQYYLPSMNALNLDFKKQVLFVRYEDLVLEPDVQVDRIREFTGLELGSYKPGEIWSEGGRDFTKDRNDGDPYINDLYGKGISTDRIGRYRKILTPAEIKSVEQECAALLTAFGYKND